MKVCAGVLTWNMFKTGRDAMFRDTIESLKNGNYPLDLVVVTNGSDDGTQDVVAKLGGIVDDSNGEIWYGMVVAIEECIRRGADLVVFSADDGLYSPGWLRKLVAFWRDMPDEVKIVCPHLSPSWPEPHSWNTVRGFIDGQGGMRGLVRDSAPGSFWTFRASDWPLIKSLMPEKSPGEDLIVSQALADQGYMVVEVDLCEHIGAFLSAWGNKSYEWATPLDRERWGI
jgi:glycosyltransferase involved in cell wall biosynthesis